MCSRGRDGSAPNRDSKRAWGGTRNAQTQDRGRIDDRISAGRVRSGGTSLSSPLFAGFTALSLQKAGSRAGLLNPVIYADAGTSTFKDVKGNPPDSGVVRLDYVNGVDGTGGEVYSVRTFDQDSSLALKAGYDNATGVGVPTTKWLGGLR